MIVDRIEGENAYIEDETGIRAIPRALLPEDAREGDVLVRTGGIWRVDAEKTEKRRAMTKNRLERLIK